MGSAASGEWQNPEFLRALVNAGETIQITVTDGAETKVTLAARK
jgi:hypothetical protein